MPSIDSFPREPLAQPPEVRMGYFAAKVVAHPRLAAAHQAVRDALRLVPEPRLLNPDGHGLLPRRLGRVPQVPERDRRHPGAGAGGAQPGPGGRLRQREDPVPRGPRGQPAERGDRLGVQEIGRAHV